MVLSVVAVFLSLTAIFGFTNVPLLSDTTKSDVIDEDLVDGSVRIERLAFSALDGWAKDRHEDAFATFQHTCRHRFDGMDNPRPGATAPTGFEEACIAALSAPGGLSRKAAREYFEAHFCPHEIVVEDEGLLTSYYEPELEGSPVATGEFKTPLYKRPGDVKYGRDMPDGVSLPEGLTAARFDRNGVPVPYFTRAEINAGALADRNLELVWVRDPVDAFFVHIQGSTRIRFPNGDIARVGYDGKNGYGYTSVGRALLRDDVIPTNAADSESIKAWLRANPDLGRAYMERNQSYVFFRELKGLNDGLGPVGGEGVQLTAQRSLAVDRSLYSYGLPFWIETTLPSRGREGGRFHNLMIAQDTGAAIKGPARGDIFWGSGPEAGAFAGLVKVPGRFVVFLPCLK